MASSSTSLDTPFVALGLALSKPPAHQVLECISHKHAASQLISPAEFEMCGCHEQE